MPKLAQARLKIIIFDELKLIYIWQWLAMLRSTWEPYIYFKPSYFHWKAIIKYCLFAVKPSFKLVLEF